MTWEVVTVIVAGIAGVVGLARFVLPYVAAATAAERKLKLLDDINKRLEVVESKQAGGRLPVGLPGRRSA